MKKPTIRWLGRAGILCAKVASTTEDALSKTLSFTIDTTLVLLIILNIFGAIWFVAGGTL